MPADAAGISTMTVSSDATNAPTSVATVVYGPMLKRMRTLPGVQDAALVSIFAVLPRAIYNSRSSW